MQLAILTIIFPDGRKFYTWGGVHLRCEILNLSVMFVWKFLGEFALFDMIRRWFSSTKHSHVPKPIPTRVAPVITNQRAGEGAICRERYSIDELHERVDALESELDDTDIMSERYDEIQDRIDELMDRIDEIEDRNNAPLFHDYGTGEMSYTDFDSDHTLFDDDY